MQGYFIENEMLRRLHGYEQDMIPSALTPSGPVVEEMVASLLVNIIGPQLMVWFMVGELMEALTTIAWATAMMARFLPRRAARC